jgi:anaerobic selenocysteine-containing dehydrogenase
VSDRLASRASVAAVLSLVAFLGGLIHYAIENNRIAHDDLVEYTNAEFIVKEGFKLPGRVLLGI